MNSDDPVSRTAQIGNMTPFTDSNTTDQEQKDREIFERNNIRLLQLANELRDISSYGGACDELLLWIKDSRAYNIHNENALLECISVIRDKAMEYGPWSGMQTLKIVNEHCMMLSPNGQQHIKKCYYELHKLVLKRRPSDVSIVSTGSIAQHSTPTSPMGQRSIVSPQSPVDAANAHNATASNNNMAASFSSSSINSLIKSLLESGIPQSPASPVASPQVSPNVSNRTAVHQSPQQTGIALTSNPEQQPLYNAFLQHYERQRTQQMQQQQMQHRPQYQQQPQQQRRAIPTQPQYQQQLQQQLLKQQQYQQKAAQAQEILKQQHLQQQQDLKKKQQQQQAAQQQQQQQQLKQQQLQQQHLQQQQLHQQNQIALQQYQQYYRQFHKPFANNAQPPPPGQNPIVQEFVQQYSNNNIGSALQVHQQQQQRQDATRIQNHWMNTNQNMVQYSHGPPNSHGGIRSASNSAPTTPVTQSFPGMNIAMSPVNQTFPVSQAYPPAPSVTQSIPLSTSSSTSQSVAQSVLLTSPSVAQPIPSTITTTTNSLQSTTFTSATSSSLTSQPVYSNSPTLSSNASTIRTPTTATNNNNTNSVNNAAAESILSNFFSPVVTPTVQPAITSAVTTATTIKATDISQRPPMRSSTTATTTTTDLYLPSLAQADINTIHLPGGGTSPKPQKLQKLSDAYSDLRYDDPYNDLVEYHIQTDYTTKPFTLMHDVTITKKLFYISPIDFQRLYIPERVKTLNDTGGHLTSHFIFNCWYKTGLESKCEWPNDMRVEMNNQDVRLHRKIRKHQPDGSIMYVGKDAAYNLTSKIRKGENVLKIHQIGCCCNYIFSISTFTGYSHNYILRLVKDTAIPIKQSYDLIDALLGCHNKKDDDDDDDDIVIVQSSVKVGLRCPITLVRINRPVRGKSCKHVGAFDLEAYLMTNKKKTNATWRCPHCSCITGPEDLRRDLMMESLLKELRKNVVEIEYTTDHSHFRITKMDDPDTDDDESDTEEMSVKYEKAVEPIVDVIDLISDDDDDDDDEHAETTTGMDSNNTNSALVPSKRARVA